MTSERPRQIEELYQLAGTSLYQGEDGMVTLPWNRRLAARSGSISSSPALSCGK
jgi:hypothetical protein